VILERLGGPQKGELWFWRGWVGPRKVNCGFGEAGWAPGRLTVISERLGGPRKLKCGFEEAGWAPGR